MASSLSIDRDDDNVESEDVSAPDIPSPLDDRVIQAIQSARVDEVGGGYSIRPARLAAKLGISMEDACAELCGLLAAVGGGEGGASFRFDKMDEKTVMVFHFPADFARRAANYRRKEDFSETLRRIGYVALRVLQIVTAFGLILSLLILCVAAIAGLVAAMIALSRSGNSGRNESQRMMHQIRSLFFTIRQLLWCFALFGPDDGGEGSFYREIAYDASLCFSVICGSPTNIFYWIRMNQLSRRRQRAIRGWGCRPVVITEDAYGVEGVSFVRRGDTGQNQPVLNVPVEVPAEHRGLLSVAVEFLFGPIPFQPGPTDEERWKMRAAYIVSYLSTHSGVSLQRLCLYADYPPKSVTDLAHISEQGLAIVAHFNGVPTQSLNSKTSLQNATFAFPELLTESELASQYSDFSTEGHDGVGLLSILYRKDPVRRSGRGELPDYLKESLFRLTSLPSNLFWQCLLLGSLNLVGVFMLQQSIDRGGTLEVDEQTTNGYIMKRLTIPVLRFYAILFFVLPCTRLAVILHLNSRRRKRNTRRASLLVALADDQ